ARALPGTRRRLANPAPQSGSLLTCHGRWSGITGCGKQGCGGTLRGMLGRPRMPIADLDEAAVAKPPFLGPPVLEWIGRLRPDGRGDGTAGTGKGIHLHRGGLASHAWQ